MVATGSGDAAPSSTPTGVSSPPSTAPPMPPPGRTAGQEHTRRMRRMNAVWAIVVVVAAIAAGIGGYTWGKSLTKSSNVTLTYYDDLAPSEQSFMTGTLIPMFEQQYPNINVQYVNLDATSMVTKVVSLVQANNVGTSLIAEDNLQIGELIYGTGGQSYLMNITNLAPLIQPATMIPSMAAITAYEPTAYHGATYFLPFRANVPLVWVNWTALHDASITTLPATAAELMTAAQTLHTHTGSGQVMFQGGDAPSTATEMFQWDVQFGGNPMMFNDQGDVNALSYISNLTAYMNPQYQQGYWGSYGGLANGQYSILDYQWPYIYANLLAGNATTPAMPASALGVYPGPNGTDPLHGSDHVVGGDVLAIPRGATNLWAIQLFSQFLLSAPAQRALMVDTNNPAVNAQAYVGLPANISVVNTAILQALENPVFRPPVPWMNEWVTLFFNSVWTPVILDGGGLSSIASAVASANSQMVSYLTNNYGASTATSYSNGEYGPLYVTP